jgi:hypothetical protein
MSKIPPIPPQIGINVGFDLVGKFNSKWDTIGLLLSEELNVVGCGKWSWQKGSQGKGEDRLSDEEPTI